jgi:DNA-binding beta-propeller fold protein YncE
MRKVIYIVSLFALLDVHCQRHEASYPPVHYLLVTHSALNRVTIFDLAKDTIVGALPTQKLPHDLLVSSNGILYVVNSGAQCITTYDLKDPEFWKYAREFMQKDSLTLNVPRNSSANMMGHAHPGGNELKDTSAWVTLNKNPMQSLPATFSRTYLTDPHFPDIAKPMHDKVNATSHTTCFDCHDRAVGSKPFGPKFTSDSSEIFMVQLDDRNIIFMDPKTLEIKRQISLPISSYYAPVEAWISPDHKQCFVTCRYQTGETKPGLILVLDLKSGNVVKSIPAGIYPWHLLPNPSGDTLYVNNFQSSRISIVDVKGMKIVDSIEVQNGPSMMLLLPDRNQLAVSCFYTDHVLIVDLGTKRVVENIPVDSNPTTLELSPDGKTLYVLCGGESALDMISMDEWKVTERHKMLFGAYAFQSVDERKFN